MASTSPAAPLTFAVPSLDKTMGAMLIGCYFAVSLYGLISHQIYRYYRMYPEDSPLLKAIVGTLWVLDTLHSILVMHICYFYLVQNYFDPLRLLEGTWSLRISISLTGLITLIAHGFFSRRIYIFSGNIWTPVAIMVISLIRFGFNLASTVMSYKNPTFDGFAHFIWIICITLGLAIISDVIITVSLCWYLQKSRTGFEKTDSIIDKLLLYSINTGLLTIVFNSAVLICASVMKKNLIFVGLYFIISKLYTNSLLAVLNSRLGLMRDNNHGSFDLQEINHVPAPTYNEPRSPQARRRKLPVVSTINIEMGNSLQKSSREADVDSENKVNLEFSSVRFQRDGKEETSGL